MSNFATQLCDLRECTRLVELELIRKDGDTQARSSLDVFTIEEYKELMKAGVRFPPVKASFDGESYWLTDGFHRVVAAELCGLAQIEAIVEPGTLDDARWRSYAANSSHGMRRTRIDVEGVVMKALRHARSKHLSNNQLAQHLGIPESTLRRLRKKLSSPHGEDSVRIAARAGRTYYIKTAAIGKRSATEGYAGPKSRRRLREDLGNMKSCASPEARRILNTVGNWMFGSVSDASCIEAVENVLQEIKGASTAQWCENLSQSCH
jgi:hypothetical protein